MKPTQARVVTWRCDRCGRSGELQVAQAADSLAIWESDDDGTEGGMSTRIWMSSDWHFGHEKLWEFGRPTNFEDRIAREHEKVLQPGDTLINCGDFAIGKAGEERCSALLGRLRARGVHLIGVRGNHDPDTITRCQRMGPRKRSTPGCGTAGLKLRRRVVAGT